MFRRAEAGASPFPLLSVPQLKRSTLLMGRGISRGGLGERLRERGGKIRRRGSGLVREAGGAWG